MNTLTELIFKSGNADRLFSAKFLEHLLGGTAASRYGLVNRALKSGELLQVRRGLYLLAPEYRRNKIHPFSVAQQLLPGSYITAESALSFHGWIPERVISVVSCIPKGRAVVYEHDILGMYEFSRMTVNHGYFLEMVSRHVLNQQVALIAEPLRALLDMVYLRKMEWQGVDFLLNGLRIDENELFGVSSSSIIELKKVYKGKRELLFLEGLQEVIA